MPAEVALRAAENNALTGGSGSFYSGSGRSTGAPKVRNRFSIGNKKGIAAMTIIIGIITAIMAFLGSSHSWLAAAVSAKFTPAIVDYSYGGLKTRKDNVISQMVQGKRVNGALSKITQLSPWSKERLATNSNFSVQGDTATWNGQTITVDLIDSNADLRADIDSTTYGRILSLQDNQNNRTMNNKFGVNGNVYKDYKQTGDSETDTAAYHETMAKQFEGKTTSDFNTTHEEEVDKYDENGNKTNEKDLKTVDSQASSTYVSDKAEALQRAKDYLGKVNIAGKVVNYACTIFRVGTTLASAIAGVATYTYAREFMDTMEPISKMMSGQGSNSPINSVLNRMTTPFTTETEDIRAASVKVSGAIGDAADCVDNCNTQGSVTIEAGGQVSEHGSMVESPNARAVLTDGKYNKQEAALHSLNKSLEALFAALTTFNITNSICVYAQAAFAATELIYQAAALAINLLPGGQIVSVGALFWKPIKSLIGSLISGVVLNFTISSVVAFLAPTLAQALFSIPDKDSEGIPRGERLVASAAVIGSQTSRRNNGGSLATKEQVIAYSRQNNTVIAQEAEIDRMNRSPFDITSSNTFLGSIVYSILPSTLYSGVTSVNTLMGATSTAIANITNSAVADGEDTAYINTFGDCQYLKDTFGDDVAADIYCNPITINDPSTFDIRADDPTYQKVIGAAVEGCDDDGNNCKIKTDSNLARYISYCADRDSPFGIVDARILEEQQDGKYNVVLNALPVVGNVKQILDAGQHEEQTKWANGEKCSMATNSDWDSEYKYYQLYIEDIRIVEQMGGYIDENGNATKDPITSYREQYEKDHPTDNSLAGYLARVSGMSKEEASVVLDVLAYYEVIQNYDISSRIVMDGESTSIKTSSEIVADVNSQKILFIDNKILPDTPYIANRQHILYADVRNRSYAV